MCAETTKTVFHLLKTDDVPELPSNISLIADFGEVLCYDDVNKEGFAGRHLVVRGEDDAIRAWLGALNGVWIGVGSPAEQRFEIHHIAETEK